MNSAHKPEFEKQVLLEMEMLDQQPPIELHISHIQLFQLISTVQLACRHPQFTGPARTAVEDMVEQFTSLFPPACRQAIQMGWLV